MNSEDKTDDENIPKTKWGLTKFLLAGSGGVLVVVLQFFTLLGQQRMHQEQNELSRQVTVSDRYNQAAVHLASDEPIERIAGIYGLKDLATDQETMQSRTIRLLASYLVTFNESMIPNERAVASGTLAAITAAADRSADTTPLAYDLSDVVLSGYNLSGLQSRGGYFVGLDVSHADLSGAWIECTNLSGAKLINANLSGTDLDKVLVDGQTDFSGVRGTEPETFAELYWGEQGPIFPPGLEVEKAGTIEDYGDVC